MLMPPFELAISLVFNRRGYIRYTLLTAVMTSLAFTLHLAACFSPDPLLDLFP